MKPRLIDREHLARVQEWTAGALEAGALVELPAEMMRDLLQHVDLLEDRLVTLDGEFCTVCGCTQNNACWSEESGACAWAFSDPLTCTACAHEEVSVEE